MATLYLFNPKVKAVVRFTDNTVYSTPTVTFSTDAGLLASLPPAVHDVTKFNPYNLRTEFVRSSSELPWNVPDALLKVELPGIRVNNPNFFVRQKRGEIVVSKYRKGEILVRTNQRLVITNPVLSEMNHSNWGSMAIRLPASLSAAEAWAKTLATSAQPNKTVKSVAVDVFYAWTTKRFTASRYESLPPVYPEGYPERPDEASVVTAAYAAILQAQMDVLTEVVELPQTVAYVHDKVTSIANAAARAERKRQRLIRRAIRKKIPRAKLLDALASIELQFRYAIMPILYSVQDAMSLLEQYGYLYKEERRTMNHSISRSDAYGEWSGNDKLTCWVKQRFDPDSVMSRLHSLIGPNPVTTLWEITLLSFVVDWVVPIGDYLTALTTPNMANEFKCSLNHRHSSYCKYTTQSGLYREIYIETYDRTPINPLDHIGLRVNPSMNWKRWLDASALSWNAVRNKLTKSGVRI